MKELIGPVLNFWLTDLPPLIPNKGLPPVGFYNHRGCPLYFNGRDWFDHFEREFGFGPKNIKLTRQEQKEMTAEWRLGYLKWEPEWSMNENA